MQFEKTISTEASVHPAHMIARASLVSSVLVALLGAVVIAGWHLRIPALLQVFPGFVPMQYNTALGFLLSGLAVFCLGLIPRQQHWSPPVNSEARKCDAGT